jgi:glycosyltransferase involved in cell wall biosynthesis
MFLGNRADVPDLLAATDVTVLTSQVEGLPNALVESMCLGVPVVSTDYPGVEELVTDGREGFVAPRGNAPALAERVGHLLQDEALRRQMGACGRRTVEARFGLEAMATNLLAAYQMCLERVGRSRRTVPGLQ